MGAEWRVQMRQSHQVHPYNWALDAVWAPNAPAIFVATDSAAVRLQPLRDDASVQQSLHVLQSRTRHASKTRALRAGPPGARRSGRLRLAAIIRRAYGAFFVYEWREDGRRHE